MKTIGCWQTIRNLARKKWGKIQNHEIAKLCRKTKIEENEFSLLLFGYQTHTLSSICI